MRLMPQQLRQLAMTTVMTLLFSGLVSLGFANAAQAAPFVATASMPTAPGVKWGEQPDGDWSLAVDQSTGAKWRIWGTGGQTALAGPNGLAAATWAGLPGDFQQNIKYLAVDSGNHHGFASGPTNTEIVELDGTASSIRGNVVRTALPAGITGFTEIAVNSVTHKVYLVNPNRESVYEFVPSTSTFTEIALPAGSAPAMVATDDTNNLVYVTNSGTGSVSVIDPATHTVANTVSVGTTPWGISIDNVHHKAYVANTGSSTISVLDISTPSATVSSTLTFSTYAPKFLSIDTTNLLLYVGSTTSGVAVVDIQANNTVNEVNGYGSAIWSIAADPVNRLGYYSTRSLHQPGYYYSNTIGYIPDITSAAPVNGTVNTVYAGHQMSAIGSATITYSKTSGTLPPGLSINAAGLISGTPTTPGVFTFTITADNGYGTDAETYSIHIPTPPPVLNATTFVDGYVGEVWQDPGTWFGPQPWKISSTWLGASYAANGINPFRVTTGSIPAGLALDGNTGAITGTPTTAGTYTFTITGTNSNLAPSNPTTQTTTHAYTITVQPARPPVIEPTLDWDIQWSVGSSPTPPYEGGGNQWTNWMSPTLATGSPSATWSISAGSVPAGLTFNANNPDIRGQVTAPAGTAYSFTLRATGSNGLYAERTFSGVVTAAPPQFNGTGMTAYEGTPFYFDPKVSIGFYTGGSGSAPLTWSYQQSTIDQYPSGFALNTSTGVVSGTPAVGTSTGGSSGSYAIDLDVSNSVGAAHPTYSLTVLPAIAASQKTTITMAEGATLAPGSTYPTVPVAGVQPGQWPGWMPQIGSQIPSWLHIDDNNNGSGTGEMTGTAPAGSAGSYVMAMQYYDSNWNPYILEVTLNVTPPAPVMASATTISKNAGATFTQSIANTGGAADACTVANSTTLPAGVSLSVVAGECSVNGTASVAVGTYTFDVQASNLNGTQTSITAVTLSLQSTPTLSQSSVNVYWASGVANNYTLTPSGGATPFTFALGTSPAAPSWASVLANGGSTAAVISSSTAVSGTGSFVVNVTNSASGPTNPTPFTVNYTTVVPPVLPAITIPAPTVGVTYTSQNPLYTIPSPTAGTGSFTYTATGLPTGLSINSTTGAITGTATSATSSNVIITVANSAAYTAYLANPANVAPSLIVSTSAQSVTPVILAPQYASAVTRYVVAGSSSLNLVPVRQGGSPATVWTVANGSTLPSWISLNSTTGALTNSNAAPSGATTETFSVVASNGTSPDATIAYTIEVAVAPVAPSLSPAAPIVGQPYSYTIPTPTTGTGPFSYSISGTLPAGLNLVNGVITGTPTAPGGAGTFTITVNNALTTALGAGAATTTSTTLTSSVVTPVLTPSTVSLASANLASVSHTPTISSSTSPATSWSQTGLPSGMAFNTATGALTGSPSVPGNYTISIVATNSAGSSSAQTVTLNATAAPIVASASPTPNFTLGVSSSYTLNTSGSNPAPTGFTAAGAPNWITVNPTTGVISGTPPVGTSSPVTFSVSVSNGVGTPTVVPISIPLVTAAPTIAASTTVGNVAPLNTSTYQLLQSGGTPASGYSLGTASNGTGNTAPSWVSVNAATGVLTFTAPPTSAIGSYTFPVTLTNSGGSVTTQVTVNVADVPIIQATFNFTIPTGSLWSHDFDADVTPSATSASNIRSWQVASSSSLPTWASASAAGVVSGTPTVPGIASFIIEVTNANGVVPVTVSITAATAPSWATGAVSPGAATTGIPYSYTLPLPSGTGPFTYSVTGLPSWATLVGNVISGTPTSSGSVSITATASNALGSGSAATQSSQIVTTTVAPVLSPTQSVSATTLQAPNTQFASLGGSPVVSWSATGLPSGLSINTSTGQLIGTPLNAGTYNVTVTASNAVSGGGTSSTAVTLTVTSPPVVAASATAPIAPTGSAYSYTVPVTAGGAPYNYSVTAGQLPSWATLNSNGTITGTPTNASGPNSVTISVSNATGTSTHVVSLSSAVPTSIAANTTVSATVNQAFSQTLTPTGTGPFSYTVTGSLPAGLNFNSSTGTISGTPTTASSGSFTVSVTGAVGAAQSTTVSYTTVVSAPTYPNSIVQFATETQPFTYTFGNTGGSNPTSHVLSGSFPNSFTFASGNGIHSGTPGAADVGAYSGTYTGSNSGGSGSVAYSLTVLGLPTLPTSINAAAVNTGTSYSLPINVTGTSLGSLTYSIPAGALPAGLSLNPQTGLISGTPNQSYSGTSSFTVTVTNQAGYQVATVVNLPIVAPVTPGASASTGVGSVSAVATNVISSLSAASPIVVTQVPSISGIRGKTFSAKVPGITGKKVISFVVTQGSLPSGINIDSVSGVLSGTPTSTGKYMFVVTVRASDGTAEEKSMMISIGADSTAVDQNENSNSGSIALWIIPTIALLALIIWFLIWLRRKKKEES